MLSPFFLFQAFAAGVWFYETYYFFAACIITFSLASMTWTAFIARKNLKKLKRI
jgi:hypothetical protein